MKSACKSFMLSVMLGLTLCSNALMPSRTVAQDLPEPAIVVSISSLKSQLADIKYLMTASGFKDAYFIAAATIKGYADGVNKEGNSGLMFYFDEQQPAPNFLAFIPVDDIELLLDVIAGMAEVEDDGKDRYVIIAPDGTEIMVKQQNGYAFLSNKAAMLESLPANPETQLGDLPKTYNLAARVIPQRVPEALRNMAMEKIREGSDQTLQQLDEGLQSELQRKNLEMQMKQFEMLLTQTNELTIGMAADQDTESLYMDVIFTGLEGSELAKKIVASKPTTPSKFTGFLMDGAAMTINGNSRITAEDASVYTNLLNDAKKTLLEEMNQDGDFSDDEFGTLEGAISKVVDVVNETLKGEVFDGGMAVLTEGKNINLAGGFQVANGRKLESAVKDLIPMLQARADEDPKFDLDVKLNSGSYKKVTWHELNLTVNEAKGEFVDAFGNQVKIILGVGDESIYVGAGSDPIPVIKRGMDETHTASHLSQFNVYVTPMLKSATSLGAPPATMLMADKLSEVGKDRISAVSDLIPNGVKSRFEMQDGILSLIKVGFDAFQNGGFPQDDF